MHAARINERLLSYWRSLKPHNSLPVESQIDPQELADVWDSCFLVNVQPHSDARYEYTMMGASLVEAYGDDMTGKTVCETLLYPHPKPLFQAFDRVVQTAEPLIEDNSFTNPAGMLVKYRLCLLPLARQDGGVPAYILGGMKWKAY